MASISVKAIPANAVEGKPVLVEVDINRTGLSETGEKKYYRLDLLHDDNTCIQKISIIPEDVTSHLWCDTWGLKINNYKIKATYPVTIDGAYFPNIVPEVDCFVLRVHGSETNVNAKVTMQRASSEATKDQALWTAIRNRSQALEFSRYQAFINIVFDKDTSKSNGAISSAIRGQIDSVSRNFGLNITDPIVIHSSYAYSLLKFATRIFVTLSSKFKPVGNNWMVDINGNNLSEGISNNDLTVQLERYLREYSSQEILPYIGRVVNALVTINDNPSFAYAKDNSPLFQELIWSYWHEEGMLVQTMNAIAMRFQNERSSPNDPLAELEISPLRPLNNMIWGYIQDEHNRLTVRRRDNEYSHHYGLKLLGRAASNRNVADDRSKFIEAFHNLLYRAAAFHREDSDTTVIANAFPLLNALKDVHLIMAEGAHNQFGDMPIQARTEMMTMQWMLAQEEMQQFLRGRYMVPYQEGWMGAVDAMKKLQGWTDTSVTHFNQLAVDGERLLLSIRYGDWSDFNLTEDHAKNWARDWKPHIQRYLHGYQAITGVDLMADTMNSREDSERYLLPSTLLQRKLDAQQNRSRALPHPRAALGALTTGYVELPNSMPRARALPYRKGE
ncbi:MAG: hypothetical protein BWK73_06725 [Thiothrix lacustris]|uniref:Uncharacterized protein n=1 Tax=Thiothrix lacustris TaxID=525917 RepID=A0A1Y1QWH6_9GAMM|nr:MAG: hypothetical protein BWK73_06725 [Thiothrix lacustris]